MKPVLLKKSEQKAVAFTLRNTFELSYAFIAEIVGTSPSSVKRWFQIEGMPNEAQAERKGKYVKGNVLVKNKTIRSLVSRIEQFVGEPIAEHGTHFVGAVIPTLEGIEVIGSFFEDGSGLVIRVSTDERTFEQVKLAGFFDAKKTKKDFVTVETESSITIVEKGRPRTVAKTSPVFKVVQKMLKKDRVADAHAAMQNKVAVESVAKFTEGRVSITDAGVFFDGEKIESALASKIQSSYDAGDDVCRSLSMFLERIKNNSDPRVTDSIYQFIEKNDIQIDSEGFIIAFKIVRSTYMDKHSNTMVNTPGTVVSMDRSGVDANPSQTCSRGLHLCSLAYIPHFGRGVGEAGSDRLVKCLVDPADFVAIPKDYNAAKARVCEYFVLEDVSEAYRNGRLKASGEVSE